MSIFAIPWVVIAGQCSSPSEAQWREITESLPEPRCNTQTVVKLAEIRGIIIKELHDAIEADLDQPTVSEMAKRVAAVRESRRFDETDPNLVGLFEPNFSDREHRTPERTRKLADKAFRELRSIKGNKPSKGNKRYHPQPGGIDPPTKCALIVSIKLNWPAPRNRQAQAMCEALYAAAGSGGTKRLIGTPNRPERAPNRPERDGFWRDHLRQAQERRDTLYSRTIERALTS
jgi:hypothetical protein